MTWDPETYLRFADLRLRPAAELLARVPAERPAMVHDLGCGPGNVTALLRARWPEADLTGIDTSPEMLAKATEKLPDVRFARVGIADWRPDAPADVIYSNAALHWLDDHAGLFPRLLGLLAPGGVLAVQMPRNHGAPSHTEMVAAAEAGPWAGTLRPLLRAAPVAAPAVYYDILRPHCAALDIWEVEYIQVLEGDNPVVAFTRGSALKPLLDALPAAERAGFEADYAARVAAAYPPRSDGRTLFPFRRLFMIAVAGA